MGEEQEERKVHFSVAFTEEELVGGLEAQKVPFDCLLSESSEFDRDNNWFYCTIPGSYFFTFTILPQMGKGASISLMKDGVGQVLLFADKKNKQNVCSQSAILDLEAENKVWLQLNAGEDYGIKSHNREPMVTFTGILVN